MEKLMLTCNLVIGKYHFVDMPDNEHGAQVFQSENATKTIAFIKEILHKSFFFKDEYDFSHTMIDRLLKEFDKINVLVVGKLTESKLDVINDLKCVLGTIIITDDTDWFELRKYLKFCPEKLVISNSDETYKKFINGIIE
jgi:hypothetical protein